MRIDPLFDAADGERRRHADVVGEHHAAKAHLFAQDRIDPVRRIAGGFGRDLWIGHVRQHHRLGVRFDPGHERHQILSADQIERTVVDRDIEMGVFQHRAVARKMFDRGCHARTVHAAHVSPREVGDDLRIVRERAIADREIAPSQIDHRREAQIDAGGADFAGHQPRMFFSQRQRMHRVGGIQPAETFERRQRAVAFLETLHAPALLVDADQLWSRCDLADRGGQFGYLRFRCEVALEQDHAGAGIVPQPVAFLQGEFGTGDADHKHVSDSKSVAARSASLHCEYGREAKARL